MNIKIFLGLIIIITTSKSFSQETTKQLYSKFNDTSFIQHMNKMHKKDSSFKVKDVFSCDYNKYECIVKIKKDSLNRKFIFEYLEPTFLAFPHLLKLYVEGLFNKNYEHANFKIWNINVQNVFVRCIANTCGFSKNKSDSLFFEKSFDLTGQGNIEPFIKEMWEFYHNPINNYELTFSFGKIKD